MNRFLKVSSRNAFVYALAIMMSVLLISCSSGGDDPDQDPVDITGDSALSVENDSDWDATVYFNDDYIGLVREHSTRTWDVPVGAHSIRIDNAELDNSEDVKRDVTFKKGDVYKITVDWRINI